MSDQSDQIRQQFPGGKISDSINNNRRRKISYKGPDGIVHPVATRVHRDATARVRLSERYRQRRLQDYQRLADILAATGNKYHVELFDGGISFTRVDEKHLG